MAEVKTKTKTKLYEVVIKTEDFCYNKTKRKFVVEAPVDMPIGEIESKTYQETVSGLHSQVWFNTNELDPITIE